MKSHNQKPSKFFLRESFAGILMLLCAAVSLTLSNTSLGAYYQWLWSYNLMGHPVAHWINDGLMAVFFLLIGLELKRELLIGRLRTFERAMLPAVAAIGGMILPAFIYIFINYRHRLRHRHLGTLGRQSARQSESPAHLSCRSR